MFFVLSAFILSADDPKTVSACLCTKEIFSLCETVCESIKLKPIDYKSKDPAYSEADIILKDKPSIVNLFIVGTDNSTELSDYPTIDITLYQNISLSIFSPRPGIVEKVNLDGYPVHARDTAFRGNLSMKNIYSFLDEEKTHFHFNELRLINSSIDPIAWAYLSQDRLITDYESMLEITDAIEQHDLQYIGPSLYSEVKCNQSINDVVLYENHTVLLSNGFSEIIVDLSQLKQSPNVDPIYGILDLKARNISVDFDPIPDDIEHFPKIKFILRTTVDIFFNTTGFKEAIMDLTKYIKLDHGQRPIYVAQPKGITHKVNFGFEGEGKVYVNGQEGVVLSNDYCVCDDDKDKCTEKCLESVIIKFDEVESHSVGNPNQQISFKIYGASTTVFPLFDIEHYADKTVTFEGLTDSEHIGLIADPIDEEIHGYHTFKNLKLHVKKQPEDGEDSTQGPEFFFGRVLFRKVSFVNNCKINSTLFSIDWDSYETILKRKITVNPPREKFDIHFEENPDELASVEFTSSKSVTLNDKYIINYFPETEGNEIHFDSAELKIKLPKETPPTKISELPDIHFVSKNSAIMTFTGDWKLFEDISQKISIDHGDNKISIQGDKVDGKFLPCPIISEIGDGDYLYQGEVLKFDEEYCLCKGDKCKEECQGLGEIIDFSQSSITKTVKNSPHEEIIYHISGSSSSDNPCFKLQDFKFKSFSITSSKETERQYVTIEGHSAEDADKDNFKTESTVQRFHNVEISLKNTHFQFDELTLENIKFGKLEEGKTIAQSTLNADFVSLVELDKNHLLTQADDAMSVVLNKDVKHIVLEDKTHVSLKNKEEKSVKLDISELGTTSPLVIFIDDVDTLDDPLHIEAAPGLKISDFPVISIMLKDSDDSNGLAAYVQFDGDVWSGNKHNITDYVTIDYGSLDIYLVTPQDANGHYKGQPPHVKLSGYGDYYVNGIKQTSKKADVPVVPIEKPESPGVFTVMGLFLMFVGIIGAICGIIYIFMKEPKGGVPHPIIPPKDSVADPLHHHDEEFIAAHFMTNNDDENLDLSDEP